MPRRLLSQNRIFIFFTAACLALNGLAYVLYLRNQDIVYSQEWVTHSYEINRQARRSLITLLEMSNNNSSYLLTGDARYLEPFNRAAVAFDANIATLRTLTQDNIDQQLRLREIDKRAAQARQTMQSLITKKGQGIALNSRDIDQRRMVNESAREALGKFVEAESQLLERRIEVANRKKDEFAHTMLVAAGASTIGLFLATISVIFLSSRGKATRRQLASSEERMALVTQKLSDGIFDYNLEEGTFYFSPRLKEMLGYRDEEFPNHLITLTRHVHPDDLDASQQAMQDYFDRKSQHYHGIFRLRHKDGRYRWMMARGGGIWGTDGRIKRLVGAYTDITEQKSVEEHLRQANQDLENFTYIASHDLRSPLVNLKGFASEMGYSLEEIAPLIEKIEARLPAEDRTALKQSLREDIPEALRFIQAAVEKMDRLTTAVLDLSRIGKRKLKIEKIDVRSMVERNLAALGHEIRTRNIKVTLGEMADVATDALALEQVIGNLLDNAVKYLDPSRQGEIAISVRHLHGETLFEVTDNGRGIAESEREKVFDFFRRASNTGEVRGQGMGMAFVKAIVQRLGGQIWFTSTPNKGTSFYFTLPDEIIA